VSATGGTPLQITKDGKAHLAEKADEVAGLFERLEDVGGDQRKAGGAPIRRAVGNLLSALWHRATRVRRPRLRQDR